MLEQNWKGQRIVTWSCQLTEVAKGEVAGGWVGMGWGGCITATAKDKVSSHPLTHNLICENLAALLVPPLPQPPHFSQQPSTCI
jgi:hypothetical protein